MAIPLAAIYAVAALGQAGMSAMAADDAKKVRATEKQQWDAQMEEARRTRLFNENLQQKNLQMNQRQVAQNGPSNSLNWLSAIQGLSRGNGQPTNLDVMSFLSGAR